MLRHRLVRQSAVNLNSSSESTNMPSPPLIRKRRSSQDSKMYKQLSSDSLDNLLVSPQSSSSSHEEGRRTGGGRRHSVACGVLYMDMQKPTLKSAFNSAVRRMSDACSLLSSAPSSTYNLSNQAPAKKKDGEVLLPHVLETFLQNHRPPPPPSSAAAAKPSPSNDTFKRSTFQTNRRFSTDCPPPTYTEAVSGWKQTSSRQKLLTRQPDVVSRGTLVAVEDDDCGNPEE